MKYAILSCALSLSLLAAAAGGSRSVATASPAVATPAERFVKNRALVARHAPGAVTVKFRFVQGDEDEEGFNIPYLCPNCSRTHYHTMKEYVGEERPMETVGYLIASDRVLLPDFPIQTKFIDSISVEFAGVEYPAVAVRRYPAQGALELQTKQPVAGAKPYVFAKDGEVAQFFYTTREDGQTISGVIPASGLRARHYAELGKELVKLPGCSVALDAKGEPISLCFREEMAFDELAFKPPATWKGEEPKLRDERIAALKRKVAASLVPVFIHREVEKNSGRGSSRRMFIDGEEMGEGGKTDLDTFGFVLENGELLVPLDFNASQTSEIDKMEAILANGSRVPLEYVGAFDRYAVAVLRFADGKAPAGVGPLKFRMRSCADLYSAMLYTTSVRSLDGRLVFNLNPEKVKGLEIIARGACVPDLRLNSSRGSIPFAVTAEGEFVVGRFKGRTGERWSSGETTVAAGDLMKLVAKREFNPEYALRKGKDRIRVAWIGVETQPLTSDLAREKKASGLLLANRTSGALVSRVHVDSPAAKAGLKEGDILLYVRRKNEAKRMSLDSRDSFGGSMFDLAELLDKLDGERLGMLDADRFAPWPDVEAGVNETFSRIGIGAEVVVAFARDGEKQEVTMKLAQAPVHFRSAKRLRAKEMGAAFAELTFEVRGYFKLADDAPGVVVCKVQPGNPAAVAGLKPLEIVTHVDDQPVKTLKEFGDRVRGKSTFSLSVRRLEKTRVVRIKLGEKPAQDK